MGLKSKEWFLGKCLDEERGTTRLGYLSRRVLDLGLKRTAKTAGHILQSCGATQQFLTKYPQHKRSIRAAPALEPYPLDRNTKMLRDWLKFIRAQRHNYGHPRFGYSWDTLRTYLTKRYGGKHAGGGGGDSLFEMVLRLTAEFL